MAKFTQKLLFTIFTLITSFSVVADDIDILEVDNLYGSNILFIMDLSGSMNYGLTYNYDAVNGDPTRLEELTGAFNDIINDTQFEGINIGLATFSGTNEGRGVGHGIAYPVKPMIGTPARTILNLNSSFNHTPATSYLPSVNAVMETREYLSAITNDTSVWSADGSTPIVDALYEAAQYFRSEEVKRGNFVPTDNRSAHPSTYNGNVTTGTVSTETASCPVADRESCTCGVNCGISELPSTGTGTVNSPTDTGGCTLNPADTVTCPANETVCGASTGCSVGTPNTVFCGAVSVLECETANPNYENCKVYDHPVQVTNSENEVSYVYEERVRCEEPTQVCDAVPSYSCPTSVTSCTKCPDTITSGNPSYISPITEACPKNGIILLTDGRPTSNNVSSAELNGLLGTTSCPQNDYDGDGNDDINDNGRCGPEIAEFLSTTDHADGTVGATNKIPDLNNDKGIQNVLTYTVGLSLTDPTEIAYMRDIADKGQGAFVNTSTRGGLAEAFANAINGIVGKTRSFAAPTYSIDTNTLLSHGNEVYIPLFDRKGAVWPGNLKKFKLDNAGNLLGQGDVVATDVDGNLITSVPDLWANTGANGELTSGGAANKINPSTRNIKTENTAGSPALVTLNASVDNSAFGLGSTTADTALKSELISFIKGINPEDNTPRYHMGDIIHSKPVRLNRAGADDTIYVGTNEGYLHAINNSDGTEAFAYMPRELLDNIKDQYEGNATPNHIYGVDGPLTLWLDETGSSEAKTGNNVLDSGEEAYLFFGLRRGGNHYYALNVTDPANPVLAWKRVIGTGKSWSQPVVTKVKDDSDNYHNALVIGGGYNEDVSGNELAGGNAVHIVRADTGAELWNTTIANSSAITKAIPSRIRVIDIDRNGLADRLYFGDTGGNIWRVDLNAGNYSSTASDYGKLSKAKLYLVAKLGASGTDSENRKFFEEPDVSIFRLGGKIVASIAIGSGDRTRPLDDSVDDRFFLLYDKEVMVKPTTTVSSIEIQPQITMDTSSGGLKASNDVVASDLSTSSFRGWHKSFAGTGEKVLAPAVTFQNKVMFTTLATTANTPDPCNPSNTNESKLYIMDLLTGATDSNITVTTGEILGEPQINFGELINDAGNTCVLGTDTDCKRNVTVRVGRAGPIAIPAPAAGYPVPDPLPRVYWSDSE